MASTFTFHGPAFARFCYTEPGQKVRIGGVEHIADGEPVTRAYEGAENIPAIEAFATKCLSNGKNDQRPQSASKLCDGVYLIVPRVPVQETLPVTPDSPATDTAVSPRRK